MARWVAGVGVCTLALSAGAAGWWALAPGGAPTTASTGPGAAAAGATAPLFVGSPFPAGSPATGPAAAAPEPTTGWIATVAGPTAWSLRPGGAVGGELGTTNPYGAPETLAVVGLPSTRGWLHVELPVRPNGTTGWIPALAAHLDWTPYSIEVDLAAKTLTVFRGTTAVLASPVAVGAPRTPTPPDHTYVWELVAPGDPSGVYGPDIFGLAEFSDALAVFNGGDAQIAIHGTDEPWTIGQAASSGCVRLPDSVVSRLVGMLPLGTPVTIS